MPLPKRDRPLLVFVGVATEDTIAVVQRYPSADERVIAESITTGGGGPAATAAVAAARLGENVALISAVGDDDAGRRVVSDLEREGVQTDGVRMVSGERTGCSVVVISGAERKRAISNQVGPELRLDGNRAGTDLIASADWVHVDQLGWGPVRAALDVMKRPPRLSVDAGNQIDGYRPGATALYAPTRAALARRYEREGHPADIASLVERSLAEGADLVVVTDGPNGSFAASSGQGLIRVPAPDAEIVSTLGAGDVFHGALLAAIAQADSGRLPGGLPEVLRFATAAATVSCRGIDGRSGIPDRDEVIGTLALMGSEEQGNG